MIQEHWRTWTCHLGCADIFPQASLYWERMQQKHKLTAKDWSTSTDSTPDLERPKGRCPLCYDFDIKSKEMYRSHIGHHLQQLALFILPGIEDADDETDGDKSRGTDSRSDETDDEVASFSSHDEREMSTYDTLDEAEDKHSDDEGWETEDEGTSDYDRILHPMPHPRHSEHRNMNIRSAGRRCKVSSCDKLHVRETIGTVRIYSIYCQDHICQSPRNAAPDQGNLPGTSPRFCAHPKEPEKRYCPVHGKCIVMGCREEALFRDRVPYPFVCRRHRCTSPGCYSRQAPGVEVCEAHLICRVTGCRRPISFVSQRGLCIEHLCIEPGCSGLVVDDHRCERHTAGKQK